LTPRTRKKDGKIYPKLATEKNQIMQIQSLRWLYKYGRTSAKLNLLDEGID